MHVGASEVAHECPGFTPPSGVCAVEQEPVADLIVPLVAHAKHRVRSSADEHGNDILLAGQAEPEVLVEEGEPHAELVGQVVREAPLGLLMVG